MRLKGIGLRNRRGSQILEASVTVPAFLIAMIMMISVMDAYAAGENAMFAACDELTSEAVKAAFIPDPVSRPVLVASRIRKENKNADSVLITGYGYLHGDGCMDDLISLDFRLIFAEDGPLGGLSRLVYDGSIRCRAFTGKDNGDGTSCDPGEEEESDPVYVFPDRGKRYHRRDCAFLNPACQQVFLTRSVKRRFRPCELCGSADALIGSVVYCFFNDGEVYHVAGCSMVDKYFVEMERADAIGKGYTPCQSCGG